MPLEFGSEDILMNMVYVPRIIPELKQRFNAIMKAFILDDKKVHY
jgi:hypothetical protein